MLNYALERGYSFTRWQTIANTILFKDVDNVRLHRTRVIHIYEADFNLALGVKWREAMHRAEDSNALNDGQYGSRSGRCAPDPVFIEELQCEISRATRKPVILTNYDATACYDRIIPNLGMLASRKYGVPLEVTKSNATTLHKAEYRVRTELGLAATGYKHEDAFPIYGTGQGSANSPGIWCMLSSALLDGYDQVATPAKYTGSETAEEVSVGMISFVDDCNGQTNQFESDGSTATVAQLFQQTQQNAQSWSDLLSASGGLLELSKCSSHVMQWKFSLQGAPVLVPSHEEFQDQLRVQDRQTGDHHHLTLLSVYDAHKTLGHYKAPIGNQMEQFRQLKRKSDDAVAFLWTCPLSKLEAWTYYYACYLPSVGYPLACSSLKKIQLDLIQRKAMSIIVARCGYNRNTKKEILYGPLELGGANFRHLYIQQGGGQIGMFIRHWRLKSTAGKLLRVALSWFQQQTGVSYSILEKVTSSLPHLESKWIGSLRQFLAETDMYLQVDAKSIPKLQRHYDYYLMDAILESKQFTDAEIRRLNYCRLYLKAVTLADITVIKGDYLDEPKLSGQVSLVSSRTHGNAIYQERPSAREWALWRKMCKALWRILSTSNCVDRMPSFGCERMTLSTRDAFKPRVHGYTAKRRSSGHGTNYLLMRLQAKWSTSDHNFEFKHSTNDVPSRSIPAATFAQFVSSLPLWEAELLHNVDLAEDPFTVSDALSHGIRAVSDGSVWTDNQGAYGWMLSSDLGDRVARGMGPARGAKVDSYRAEAYGMLTILCFLRRLAEFTIQVEPWTGILATDSQSLLDTITVKPPKRGHSKPSVCTPKTRRTSRC
ncbi:hypothetical protein MHU86_15148 [Fragilaria crotonensis]|nr:hypothetical protein MHU86_15148 [Fragilaria crotonensis]